VRHRTSVLWSVIVIAVAALAAAPAGGQSAAAGEEYLGTWSGTWEAAGSASGGIEITLEKDKTGVIAGKVSVTGEPAYTATMKSLEFEGKKMTAKYDFPPDASAEVVLAATFDGSAATGTWSAREKASGNEVAAGTWSVKKKS
jgi:hypothetical protein